MTWTFPSSAERSTMEVPTNQIKGRSMSKIIRVGIDLSKSVFVLYGVDEHERCRLKRTLRRVDVLKEFATLEPCVVGMEAGSGAHY